MVHILVHLARLDQTIDEQRAAKGLKVDHIDRLELEVEERSCSLRPYETRRPGSSSSSIHLDMDALDGLRAWCDRAPSEREAGDVDRDVRGKPRAERQ